MVDLVLGSAAVLAAATVGLALYSAGVSYRFRRLAVLREALEARCAALRDEAEGHEALARELAAVRAETKALQVERASVERELKHIRAEAERKVELLVESLVVRHTASARALEEKAREREEKARALEEKAQREAKRGSWSLGRRYTKVEVEERLSGIHGQVEATLDLFWSDDTAKGKPLRHVMLKCAPSGYPQNITEGSCEFQGRSQQEWRAYRDHQDSKYWGHGSRYYALFHYEEGEEA